MGLTETIAKFKKIDGRWLLGGSHFFLLIVTLVFYKLQRSPVQIFTAYATAVIVEIFFYKYSSKNKARRLFDCIFSACTEAAGLLILVRSPYDWLYIPLSFLAVSSKYIFRRSATQHLFNPTNFAIVAAVALLPKKFFEMRGDEFNLNLYPMLHVTLFGLYAVYLGKTWRVALSYFLTIVTISMVLSRLIGESPIYLLGPELGASGLIFMFLMITDPKTSPTSSRGQIWFGMAIGCLMHVLKYNEFFYAQYFSLFVILVARGLYIAVMEERRVLS